MRNDFDFEGLFLDSLTPAQLDKFGEHYRKLQNADLLGADGGADFSIEDWHQKLRRKTILWAVTREASPERISMMIGGLTGRELMNLDSDIKELGLNTRFDQGVDPLAELAA